MKNVLICPHSGTDFDAFGAAVGASLLFERSTVYLPEKLEEALYAFIEYFFPGLLKSRGKLPLNVDTLVVVDTRHWKRTDCKNIKYGELILIDHHPDSGDILATEKIEAEYGATSTVVTLMLKNRGVYVSPEVATALLAGIYEDTGYLSFAGVTPEDFEAAAFLMREGAKLEVVTKFVKNSLSPPQLEILQEMISEGEVIVYNRKHIGIVVLRLDKYVHDISLVVNHYLNAMDLDAAFVVLDLGNRAMIIGRSRNENCEILPVIKKLGGGGHKLAASAVVEKIDIIEVVRRLKEVLEEFEEKSFKAGDIMFSPLITIGEGRRIEEAAELFNFYNFNVLPVINRSGKLAGLITRQIVDKLLFHNLSTARVRDFMLTEIKSVTPSSSIYEVKKIMVENNQRFVPVVDEEDFPIGGITRKELVKVIVEDDNEEDGKPVSGKRRNIANMVTFSLADDLIEVIKEIGSVADTLGMKAYIVGGSVRDIILRRKNFDIDIVIEGDAIKVAEKFAESKNYNFARWPRFGTATVYVRKLHFDFSSARLEYYPRGSASYPIIRRGSLYQDLYRRDFTINAMAMSISPSNFGDLYDPFRGYYDLKKKVLRIIHQLSFIEDPARILRAARFAGKLGFSIGRATKKALKSALQMDIFNRFPTRRLFHEFNRIMEEEHAPEIFLVMEKFGIINRLVKGIQIRDRLYRDLLNAREAMSWLRMLYNQEDINASVVNWLIVRISIGESKFKELSEILMVPKEFLKHLKGYERKFFKTKKYLSSANAVSDIIDKLDSVPVEVIVLVFALIDDEDKRKLLSTYLTSWRGIKPEIKGEDLIKLGFSPGPIFSKIFAAVKTAKIEGQVRTREEELNFVLEKFSHLIEKKEN